MPAVAADRTGFMRSLNRRRVSACTACGGSHVRTPQPHRHHHRQLVPIHRDGYKFLAIGAGVCLLLFLVWPPLAWIAVLITAWIAYFFRDPRA